MTLDVDLAGRTSHLTLGPAWNVDGSTDCAHAFELISGVLEARRESDDTALAIECARRGHQIDGMGSSCRCGENHL